MNSACRPSARQMLMCVQLMTVELRIRAQLLLYTQLCVHEGLHLEEAAHQEEAAPLSCFTYEYIPTHMHTLQAVSTPCVGGTFYKGTVTNVRQQQPSAIDPLELREAYDPWEALEVEWDIGGGHGGNDCEKVSPWELESDPDEDLRREEERKKEQEASSRAARAARGARRCVQLAILVK